jgi:hypothetical protein
MQQNIAVIQLEVQVELHSSTLDECKQEARKAAEGVGDAAQGIVTDVFIAHYASGSGEPVHINL